MGIKAALSLPVAKYVVAKNNKWKSNAIEVQKKLLNTLIKKLKIPNLALIMIFLA